jgi:hypothetical protein
MDENEKFILKSSLERVTFTLPHSEKVSLKMICLLTNKTMSTVIRMAIKDKIKEIKGKE